jgi:hypothetical protein
MTFSALFTKTHRILTIMRNAAAFKRVKVTALDVAKPMIALLMTNVIILAVWTGIDPLTSETVVLQTNRFDQPTVTKNVCTSDHQSIFLAVLGVINLGALFIAFVEAYLARNISVELSESAYIMKAISMILLVSFIGIPVIIITQENVSFYKVVRRVHLSIMPPNSIVRTLLFHHRLWHFISSQSALSLWYVSLFYVLFLSPKSMPP